MKSLDQIKDLLKDIGMNNLETDIYVALLQKPGMTGYKIAGAISKPVANTYKALSQLENKGLVVCSESDGNKSYSTIDISEYMDRLEHEFRNKREKIVNEIKQLSIPERNFGSYNLTDKQQVIERAKSIIISTKDVLMIDSFPLPYEALKDTIAQKENVNDSDIRLKLYHQTEQICKHTLFSYSGDLHLEAWIGQWLTICKDSDEVLVACFNSESDDLIHAIWTTDPLICFSVFNGMVNEYMLIEILNQVYEKQNTNCEQIKIIHKNYVPLFDYEGVIGNKIMKTFFSKK